MTLLLEGRFDGKPLKQEKVVRPGTSWTGVAMDVVLPPAFRSDLTFSVAAPEDVRVLLRAVHFVPVHK